MSLNVVTPFAMLVYTRGLMSSPMLPPALPVATPFPRKEATDLQPIFPFPPQIVFLICFFYRKCSDSLLIDPVVY